MFLWALRCMHPKNYTLKPNRGKNGFTHGTVIPENGATVLFSEN